MLAPRSSPSFSFSLPLARAFDVALLPWRRTHLGGVHVAGARAAVSADHAILLVANHVSWWDGFLLRAVQRALRPHAALFTVMDEAQLRRFPFLRAVGVVGISPGSPASARTMLRTIVALRARSVTPPVVAFFPQGRIWPSSRRPLGFARGVLKVAAALAPAAIVPVALHIEPLNTAKPHAFALAGPPIAASPNDLTIGCVERAVEGQLDRLRAFLDRTGEDAARMWPSGIDAARATAPEPSSRRACRKAPR